MGKETKTARNLLLSLAAIRAFPSGLCGEFLVLPATPSFLISSPASKTRGQTRTPEALPPTISTFLTPGSPHPCQAPNRRPIVSAARSLNSSTTHTAPYYHKEKDVAAHTPHLKINLVPGNPQLEDFIITTNKLLHIDCITNIGQTPQSLPLTNAHGSANSPIKKRPVADNCLMHKP
ncbi:hypothetical protein HOY82DRAFT_536217 [Tuber indicum]|nr:hypothetical protein HOY82DRAFT_536217 [Tuber indicum]